MAVWVARRRRWRSKSFTRMARMAIWVARRRRHGRTRRWRTNRTNTDWRHIDRAGPGWRCASTHWRRCRIARTCTHWWRASIHRRGIGRSRIGWSCTGCCHSPTCRRQWHICRWRRTDWSGPGNRQLRNPIARGEVVVDANCPEKYGLVVTALKTSRIAAAFTFAV